AEEGIRHFHVTGVQTCALPISLLLAIGTNPAAASATVHLAEIGTTLASGISHWRFGNIDWKVVAKIAIPGAVGAFAGATFLSSLSTAVAAPVMAPLLLPPGPYP